MGTSNARAAKRRELKVLKKDLKKLYDNKDFLKLSEDNDLVGLTKAQIDQLNKGEYEDVTLQQRYNRLRFYIGEILRRESRLTQLTSENSGTAHRDNQVSNSPRPVVGDAEGHAG